MGINWMTGLCGTQRRLPSVSMTLFDLEVPCVKGGGVCVSGDVTAGTGKQHLTWVREPQAAGDEPILATMVQHHP